MKNTFFRVQNKFNPDDYVDFKKIDEARKYCADNALSETLWQLEKWHPNRRSPKREVQLSFIMREEKAVGLVIQPDDFSQIAVIGALVNQ